MSYVNDNTKCYYCEKSHIEHNEKIKKDHDYYHVCFLSIK